MFCQNLSTPLSKMISIRLRVSPARFVRHSSSRGEQQDNTATKRGTFSEFYEITKETTKTAVENCVDFELSLKNYNFINLEGKQVVDTIFHIVDNDLYIDFEWKSYRVCTRLVENADLYIKRSQD